LPFSHVRVCCVTTVVYSNMFYYVQASPSTHSMVGVCCALHSGLLKYVSFCSGMPSTHSMVGFAVPTTVVYSNMSHSVQACHPPTPWWGLLCPPQWSIKTCLILFRHAIYPLRGGGCCARHSGLLKHGSFCSGMPSTHSMVGVPVPATVVY
jgi:hypothetical protein